MLMLIWRSRLLIRIREGLARRWPWDGLLSLLCAALLVLLVEAARRLGSALAAAFQSDGASLASLSQAAPSLPVTALIGGACLWSLLAARRRWPRRGWAGVSVAATLGIFCVVLLPPVTLTPALRGDWAVARPQAETILAFVRRGGLDVRKLYVFDSADPLAVDMEGLGPIGHAAVSRAALAAPQPETYAAIGHLLGHHRHKDLWSLALLWSAFTTLFFFAVWTVGAALARRADQAPSASALDARMLPIIALIGWGLVLIATPAFNLFDQAINYRADDYALSLTGDRDALCRWLIATEATGKADPSPLEALLFYDHPPLKARLFNALRWKAAPRPRARSFERRL